MAKDTNTYTCKNRRNGDFERRRTTEDNRRETYWCKRCNDFTKYKVVENGLTAKMLKVFKRWI